jgi:hypothetical protein
MQDSDVVSAIVAGDPDGLAEAYDRYAAPLYAQCRRMLPGPDAADAVQDTFVIATSRLDGLRDPGTLGPWLHAVARNECVRRLGSAAPPPKDAEPPEGAEAPEGAGAGAAALPPGLREQVLAACADDTPAGRAYRVGVVYRAGAFRGTGFPRPLGPPWWRRPRVALGVALAVLTAAAAAGTALAFSGGPHPARAATFARGGGFTGSPAQPAPTAPDAPATTATGRPANTPGTKGAKGAKGTPAIPGQASTPTMAPQAGPPAPASAPPSSARPPSPAPQPSPPPAQGYLMAAPDQLILVPAAKGKTRGTFMLTAAGGPVASFVIKVPPQLADRVKVIPSSGSLPSGGEVQVTVIVSGKAPLDADLAVNPGGITVTVLVAPGGGA